MLINSINIIMNKNNKKIFEIIDFPNKGEDYQLTPSNSANAAALKAFTKLSKEYNLQNTNKKNHLVFNIKNKQNGKIYKFIGTRIKLMEPLIVERNGKKISYNYRSIVAKYDQNLNN